MSFFANIPFTPAWFRKKRFSSLRGAMTRDSESDLSKVKIALCSKCRFSEIVATSCRMESYQSPVYNFELFCRGYGLLPEAKKIHDWEKKEYARQISYRENGDLSAPLKVMTVWKFPRARHMNPNNKCSHIAEFGAVSRLFRLVQLKDTKEHLKL